MFSFVLYHSKCVHRDFSTADLDILRVAIAANESHDITGFLHREAGYYIQYYEGHRDQVAQLTANLNKDKRHYDFTVIDEGESQVRRFEGWSMGYSNSPTTTLGVNSREDALFEFTSAEVLAFLQAASAVGEAKT